MSLLLCGVHNTKLEGVIAPFILDPRIYGSRQEMHRAGESRSLSGTEVPDLLTSLQDYSDGVSVVWVIWLGDQSDHLTEGTKQLGGTAARAVLIVMRDALDLTEVHARR